jgi:hypothetical protein
MRSSHLRVATSIVVGLLVGACTSAPSTAPATTTPPSGPPASVLASATPSVAPSVAPVPTDSPTLPPAQSSVALPVHGSALPNGLDVRMAPGPSGGLYVSIPAPKGAVVLALLDSAGRPQAGWPIELAGATKCGLLVPVEDGSIRVVCSPEDLNRELNSGMRAFAFDAIGRALQGWPVDLGGGFTGRAIGTDLTLFGRQSGDVCDGPTCGEGWIATIAPDGTLRSGVPVPLANTCCGGGLAVGPDGVAYGVETVSGWDDGSAEVSRITAVDLAGVRPGWPVKIDGIASGPAFGPDGRIVLTVGSFAHPTTRVLVFNRAGKVVSPAVARLPIATAQSGVDCVAGDPEAPVVAQDGTIVVFSEVDTRVFAVDPSLAVLRGWPYRPGSRIEGPGWNDPRYDIPCPSIERPVVGPESTLYLPLHARSASVGGSIVALSQGGRVRPGWPVELQRSGAEVWSLVVGADGTVFALAMEPEPGGGSSATVLAIAPDSTVRYRATIIDR